MKKGYFFTVIAVLGMMFFEQISFGMTSLKEVAAVFVEYYKNPSVVGEFFPLSAKVGKELGKFIGDGKEGKRYLEIGGGCGAVTMELASKLRDKDHLDVVEINPRMCAILANRLQEYKNVTVHCCSILDWLVEQNKYDAIVSTLPFNSLGVDFAMRVIELVKAISKDFCTFSYVEYPIIRQAVQYFYTPTGRKAFSEVQKYLGEVRFRYEMSEKTIYANVPPVTIYHLCFGL